MSDSIYVKNLSKKYNGECVLDDINQTFSCGHSYAFLGHNGCGKSTFLRLLSGLTVPTKGSVTYSRPFTFTFVPEKFKPISLTGRTFLRRMGQLDGISAACTNEKINQMAKDFFLDEMLDIPMKSLSKGTLQKIGVIQAMLKQPDILLLDEPLSGQDVESQKVFADKINEMREAGITVFMSCHEKWIVDAISDRVYSIKEGHLISNLDVCEQNYILFVERTSADTKPWSEMRSFKTGYQMRVAEENIKQVIEKLWLDGWKLRGMYDENN